MSVAAPQSLRRPAVVLAVEKATLLSSSEDRLEAAAPLVSTLCTATVIICTRDRPDGLVVAANSVLESCQADSQVVVVDQSSDHRTRDVMLPYGEGGQVKYVPSDLRGLSRARNEGMRHALGELIFFTDDDCVVPVDWIEKISARFAADPRLGTLVAPVVAEHPWSDWGWTPTYEPLEPLLVETVDEFPVSGMMGANMVFRRSALDAIQGFDEVLGPGAPLYSADDIDAVYRVVLAGYRIAIDTEPSVIHFGLRPRENGEAAKHLALAYRSIGAYYAKHIRCGDRASIGRFARQLRGASTRAPGNLVRNRGQIRVISPLMLAIGAFESLRFAVNRSSRQFVAHASERRNPALQSLPR
jgi:GT2 family glycosyltransferase